MPTKPKNLMSKLPFSLGKGKEKDVEKSAGIEAPTRSATRPANAKEYQKLGTDDDAWDHRDEPPVLTEGTFISFRHDIEHGPLLQNPSRNSR